MMLRKPFAPDRAAPRGGYVIFAVLIVVVVLSLVAYRFADSMTGEYRAGVRANDDAQVKLAAISGLHYAAAVLADRTTFYEELDGNPFDNADIFEEFDVPVAGGPTNASKQACFSIRCVAVNDAGAYEQRFGVIDEGGKLNINSLIALDPTGELLYAALMLLPGMTDHPDVADAIVDWVDADDTQRASGAESSYYLSLSPAYNAKNGPMNSLEELLLVKGMTPYLLYGGDTNRNGIQDDGETDATRGLSDYLTVYGRELNVDMTGTARIYLNGEPDTMLQQLIPAVGEEMATYIAATKLFTPKQVTTSTTTVALSGGSGGTTMTVNVSGSSSSSSGGSGGGASGGSQTMTATLDQLKTAVQTQGELTLWSSKTKIASVMDLIGTQITLPTVPGAPKGTPTYVAYSPLNDPAKRNDLLAKLMDKTTATKPIEMVPRLNVNTAPRTVLMSLPGMTDATADAIIAQRAAQVPTDPATVSGAWLVTTPGLLTTAQYKLIEKYVTGSSMVYRVQSIGYYKGATTGPQARMEAVIDTNQGAPRFLFVRDLADLENPRGFQPNAQP